MTLLPTKQLHGIAIASWGGPESKGDAAPDQECLGAKWTPRSITFDRRKTLSHQRAEPVLETQAGARNDQVLRIQKKRYSAQLLKKSLRCGPTIF